MYREYIAALGNTSSKKSPSKKDEKDAWVVVTWKCKCLLGDTGQRQSLQKKRPRGGEAYQDHTRTINDQRKGSLYIEDEKAAEAKKNKDTVEIRTAEDRKHMMYDHTRGSLYEADVTRPVRKKLPPHVTPQGQARTYDHSRPTTRPPGIAYSIVARETLADGIIRLHARTVPGTTAGMVLSSTSAIPVGATW